MSYYLRLVIVQARARSTRLPEKALLPVGRKAIISYQLISLRRRRSLNDIAVATSQDKPLNYLVELVKDAWSKIFRGGFVDILDRYRTCASRSNGTTLVRLIGDCTLSDSVLIDELV